jgi:hypothetical protein
MCVPQLSLLLLRQSFQFFSPQQFPASISPLIRDTQEYQMQNGPAHQRNSQIPQNNTISHSIPRCIFRSIHIRRHNPIQIPPSNYRSHRNSPLIHSLDVIVHPRNVICGGGINPNSSEKGTRVREMWHPRNNQDDKAGTGDNTECDIEYPSTKKSVSEITYRNGLLSRQMHRW